MVLPKSFHVKLGCLLRSKRLAKEHTQAEVAARCGVGTQYISNIERGLCTPSLDLLSKMLLVLQIDLVEVIELLTVEVTEALMNCRDFFSRPK